MEKLTSLCGRLFGSTEFQIFFFFAKIEYGLYFLDRFNVLISKIIFKKWKNVIGMYFGTKSYLKSNHYYTAKHPLELVTLLFGLLHFDQTGKKKIQLRDNCRRFKLVFPCYSPWNYKGGDGFVFGKAVNIIFLNVFYLKNILK